MTFRSFLRHLLPALAVAGLILTPLARPAMAHAAGMHAAMHADMSTAMSDNLATANHAGSIVTNMSCCPEPVSAPDHGKDCPMMALCATSAFPNAVPAFELSVPLTLAGTFIPGNASGPDGLTQSPLPRPPKI